MDKKGDHWQNVSKGKNRQKQCRNMQLLLLDKIEKAWYNNKAVGRKNGVPKSEKHATLGKLNCLTTFLKKPVKKNQKKF